MKIFAALREDMQYGYIWLQDPKLPPRSIVKIENKANGKRVYCEALQIDENFLKAYNQSPRVRINNASEALVIGAWYRASLGDIPTQDEVDLNIVPCNSLWGRFLACANHPQTVVRIATWLGLIGVGLGAVGFLLSFGRSNIGTTMTATLWIALGAIAAALIARGVKISEFRQAWIDGIRSDVSEYMSKAHQWMEQYWKFNGEGSQKKKNEMAPHLDRLKYDAFHLLRRVELRFKPDDDPANMLIGKLKDLLDPQKLAPPHGQKEWSQLADDAVSYTRRLLKEEWEVTKNPLRKRWTGLK